MKNTELTAILKSGLVGALAFTGGIFILSIASSFTCRWMVWLLYVFFLSVDFPKTVFAVLGSIGFILGLLLRRRFPIIQRGVLPLVIALVLLIISLGWRDWLLHKIWTETELPPVNLKLADCTNNKINVHLTVPMGNAYQLELKVPKTQLLQRAGEWTSLYKFSGHLRISNNRIVLADLPISSDKTWLTGSGYVLTGAGLQNTNVPPLSNFIKSNESYDFEIRLEPSPPPVSSIWLYWRAANIDK